MPGNKYIDKHIDNHIDNSSAPTRIERLLRERELRKSSKAASHSNEATGSNRGSELSEHELSSPRVAYVEQYLEGALAFSQRPPNERQRLLVVANRLPVSAVRRGEETWSLEISAGGLVSALLGK